MVWTVPGAPAMLNSIVSAPTLPAAASPETALVLAAVIASRSVTKPSTAIVSSVPVTVLVAGTARISSGSRPRRTRRAGPAWRERIGLLDRATMRRHQLAIINNLLRGWLGIWTRPALRVDAAAANLAS